MHTGGNELQSAQPVGDARQEGALRRRLDTAAWRADQCSGIAIDLRKCFKKALGMTGGDARRLRGRDARSWSTARDDDRRFAEGSVAKSVGILLRPFDRACLSVGAQAKPVLVPWRHLAAPKRSPCAAGEAKQHVRVVIEPPPGH